MEITMSNKQLAALFLRSIVPWIAGNGLIPLLSVYAAQLGASSAVAGYYLAVSYMAITLGALSAGSVSDGLHRRKLPLIIAGLVGVPVAWLIGQVTSVSKKLPARKRRKWEKVSTYLCSLASCLRLWAFLSC